jgi:hypothetical protein
MRLRRLLWDQVETLPYTSGLYFFDEQLRLSYVGKAQRLKARIIEHMDRCVQVHAARDIAAEGALIDLGALIVGFGLILLLFSVAEIATVVILAGFAFILIGIWLL